MRYTLTCNDCGHEWSARGEYEERVRSVAIYDDKCEECGGDDFEIGEGEADEDDDDYL